MQKVSKLKTLLAVVTILLPLLCVSSQITLAKADTNNILVIHQYSSENQCQNLFDQGLRERLVQDEKHVYKFSFEYLEMDRYPEDDNYVIHTANYFRHKKEHSNWIPDVIVTSGGVSDWLLPYKEELFGDIPIVATAPSYNRSSSDQIDSFTEHYLLAGQDNFSKNYSLILDILPDTKKIYVVVGNSAEEKSLLDLARAEADQFRDKADIVFTNQMSYAEMISTMKTAESDSVILFSRWLKDIEGNSFVPAEVLSAITDGAEVPVFGTQHQYLGLGIIGGYLYDISLLGKDAAILVMQVLNRSRTSDFSNLDRYNRYIFDNRALVNWDIDLELLPKSGTIEFVEDDFWSQYGSIIVGIVIIFILETLLIIALVCVNRKRVQAETGLLVLNEALENTITRRTLDLQRANMQLEELNKILHHTARIDALTGLYNRRHMEERLNEEHEVFVRTGRVYSVMIVDIDDFKLVNDTYSHAAGDEVLVNLANILQSSVRKYDVTSRWGGEEFLLLLPGLNEEDALFRAEILRKKVQEIALHYEEHEFSITITIGVATIGENESVDKVVNRADLALYKGKNSGKNTTILSA